MSIESTAEIDAEAERQERLADLIAEHDSSWLEQFKPGTFGCHELLDRAAFFAKILEDSLLSHPASQGGESNPSTPPAADSGANLLLSKISWVCYCS